MVNQLIQQKYELMNATIYVDYENIFELLKKYGVNPVEHNFFPIILDKLKNNYKLNVIECIAYCNFEKKPFQGGHQTVLQNLGIQTRHAASNGKNCSDLMLTVDSLTTLYKNPNISVFVIVSSDRDMIPLLKAIKYENRYAYVISTRYGFDPIVAQYADHHEYIEDFLHLTPDMLIGDVNEDLDLGIRGVVRNSREIENAKEVSKLLYTSNVWKAFENKGEPVTLKGYMNIVSKKIERNASQIARDFELAHYFKYLTIYKDPRKGLCLKKGDNYQELSLN
ncbi:MAG: NYN domain-containing protein [Firmicutes bacterium]|nr:NYN domain-containing protein [Bacillota bacterium]